MYSVSDYGRMIADQRRMNAYEQALRRAVRPGCVVLDLGTGTGIFALLACRLGARRVWAVDPSDAIEVGREIAARNGFSDRIEFVQGRSQELELPERADVLVSDLRGVLPYLEGHFDAIADARRRLLVPGGRLIPREDRVFAVPVEATELYAYHAAVWERGAFGLDLEPGRRPVVNSWWGGDPRREVRLAPPALVARVVYATVENEGVTARLDWTVERSGLVHGFRIWFDSDLDAAAGVSNAPWEEPLVYGSRMLPLAEPVPVVPGDAVRLALRASLVRGTYVWSWETHVEGGRCRRKAHFRQSTFCGLPLSRSLLRAVDARHRPRIDGVGRIDRRILALMDGSASLEEIARRVVQEFPAEIKSWRDALARAGELSARYGRA